MKLKIILSYIIVVFLLLSCNSHTEKEKKYIIGSWSLLSVDDMIFNQGPNIHFFEYNGKLIMPSGKEIEFTYLLLDGYKIKLSFIQKQPYFNQNTYIYTISSFDNKLDKLELSSKNKKSKYILLKER